MGNFLDTDQLILRRIHSIRIIPYLTTFDQYLILITIAVPEKSCSLFIEREDNPLLYQEPDHDQNLDSIWNLSFKKTHTYTTTSWFRLRPWTKE